MVSGHCLNSFGLRERAFKLLGRLNVMYNSPHIVAVSLLSLLFSWCNTHTKSTQASSCPVLSKVHTAAKDYLAPI